MESESLAHFLSDASARFSRIASSQLAATVPAAFRPAAESVLRQAGGTWTIETCVGNDFKISSALQRFVVGEGFSRQCAYVFETVTSSQVPQLRSIVGRMDEAPAAILSAFFHYFVIHELLHVEQGLGSDQYSDSDLYMPIVMEADHVADVAGLAIALDADIPELGQLDRRERMLLFIAIHIAAMHSFGDAEKLDSYAFSRLLVWYVHFARFCKTEICPDLDSPMMHRPWIVSLPRLIGREDQVISVSELRARSLAPYAATSEVVLAYHQEDGLYRIHRASLTDPARVLRLCEAIVEGRFDDVRQDLEEWLVNNPALVPTPGEGRRPSVEWAAGPVFEALEELRPLLRSSANGDLAPADRTLREYSRFVGAVRSSGGVTPAVKELIRECRDALEQLHEVLSGTAANHDALNAATLQRRAISLVEQIVLEFAIT